MDLISRPGCGTDHQHAAGEKFEWAADPNREAPVVPEQIDKLRMFTTVFWVSLRQN